MDLQFLYLLVANAVLIILVRLSKNRKWLHNTLTFITTALITVTIIEGVYRLFIKKKDISETGNFGSSFNEPVALTGYTVKGINPLRISKKDKKGNIIYEASYTIIPDSGFNVLPINHRSGYRLSDPARDSVEIIFLGCSFTFATGIGDSSTMAYLTGRELQYNSLNYGGSGYGTHQVYTVFANKYKSVPDNKHRIFVYTFLPDHILRAKCIYPWSFNDPYYDFEGDSLILEGPAYKNSGSARWQLWIRALSLNRGLSFVADLGNAIIQQKGTANVDDNDYRRVGTMMEQMGNIARQRGDDFIILHWNDYLGSRNPKGGYFVSPDKVSNIMNELANEGNTVVPLSSFFNTHDAGNLIAGDNHPSASGNSLLAMRMSEVIRQVLEKRAKH